MPRLAAAALIALARCGPGVADEKRIWRFEPDGGKPPIASNGTRGLAGVCRRPSADSRPAFAGG